MTPHPLIDKEAPSFSIPDANGEMFKFPPEEEGKRVEKPIALFFYPHSGKLHFTGCRLSSYAFANTQEPTDVPARLANSAMRSSVRTVSSERGLCDLTPQLTDRTAEKEIFKRSDVLVVGVSTDPVLKQRAFVEKHKLSVSIADNILKGESYMLNLHSHSIRF